MNRLSRGLVQRLMALGPGILPFADVATPDLPLSRLLRLSLFQVSVGMAMVLLVGTLNRVMIVELGVSASLVGLMIALPIVFAPFRALVGFNSDHHRCELGWRRVPFIWKGTLWQFAGFALMPLALLVLAGKGQSGSWPPWFGQLSAAAAFLMVGAGVHTVQTAGLALATDLTPEASHPRVAGLMYVMLLIGMIVSALVFGVLLSPYHPGRLVQVVQGAAVVTLVLNGIAMWKQEARNPPRGRAAAAPDPSFRESLATFLEGESALRRLLIVAVGTLAFGLADVLLEPFGGQVLQLEVASTTKLTALLSLGGLSGFAYASHALARGAGAHGMSTLGAVVGIPGFFLVLGAASSGDTLAFLAGNFLIGFGGALFGHGTLTAAMSGAPPGKAGLAIGAWGAVQATAAGLAMGLSGALRDGVEWLAKTYHWAVSGYEAVYLLEALLLLLAVILTVPLARREREPSAPVVEGAMS